MISLGVLDEELVKILIVNFNEVNLVKKGVFIITGIDLKAKETRQGVCLSIGRAFLDLLGVALALFLLFLNAGVGAPKLCCLHLPLWR